MSTNAITAKFRKVAQNNPADAGKLAARKVLFSASRYAIAPVHTRFDAVQWFVWDAENCDPMTDGPSVIRQANTAEEALRGLCVEV